MLVLISLTHCLSIGRQYQLQFGLRQRPRNALTLRPLHLYRLTIPHGGSIAVVYSRPPWLLDYEFAPDTQLQDVKKRPEDRSRQR